MKLRTDQREVLRPQVEQPQVAALPVSVRSVDSVSRNDRSITGNIQPIVNQQIDMVDEIDNPQELDYMKLPNLRDIGRAVTKIGTVYPNPVSTAVNVVNRIAPAFTPQPPSIPKNPRLTLPPPPVNLNPVPITPRLVDPNAKPKGWFMTTYENTFNNGITGKQIVWGLGIVAGIFIIAKTNVGRKVKRMFGGR